MEEAEDILARCNKLESMSSMLQARVNELELSLEDKDKKISTLVQEAGQMKHQTDTMIKTLSSLAQRLNEMAIRVMAKHLEIQEKDEEIGWLRTKLDRVIKKGLEGFYDPEEADMPPLIPE